MEVFLWFIIVRKIWRFYMENDQKYEYLADDPKVKTLPIMLSLIIGAFFAVLNETLLNIALTTLMDKFQITLPTAQWMATGSCSSWVWSFRFQRSSSNGLRHGKCSSES